MYHTIHARFSCIRVHYEISNNEDELSLGFAAPSDEDWKLKNVDALIRYHLIL
jgi:hypothetical protein